MACNDLAKFVQKECRLQCINHPPLSPKVHSSYIIVISLTLPEFEQHKTAQQDKKRG